MTPALLAYITVPVVLCACATRCAAAGGIADVRSMEDLRALAPIRTADGWEVRLGVGDPGPDAGPYQLLYCLSRPVADQATAGARRIKDSEPLGPLAYNVSAAHAARQRSGMMISLLRDALHGDTLHVAQVRLPEAGEYQLRVTAADGSVVSERVFEVAEPRPAVWQTFAAARYGAPGQRPEYVVDDEPWAAVPSFHGAATLRPPDARAPSSTTSTTADAPRAPTPLPGMQVGEPRLRLTLEDGRFLLRAPSRELSEEVDENVLARWWVNGRPVEPRPSGPARARQNGKQVLPLTDQLTVAFGLPDHLGDLRAGDRVSVQLLHATMGHRPIHDQQQSLQKMVKPEAILLRISNRLDIVITPELLEREDHPTTGAMTD